MPLERVETELCTLAGQIASAMCRFLELLADFDAREGWAGWNVRSCAHWLSWRVGLDLRTAREHVRVARALANLPEIQKAFADGRVSYSKVRAIARVATTESEADLLDAALNAPAAHLERLTRGLRTASTLAGEDLPGVAPRAGVSTANRVHWRWDDDGTLAVWGRLSPEDGARLLAGATRADAERRRTEDKVQTAGPREAAGTSDVAVATQETGHFAHGSAEPSPDPDEPRSDVARSELMATPPSDLGPALVAMAELTSAIVEAPVHAPAADVLVHVEVRDLAAAFAEQPSDPAGQLEEQPFEPEHDAPAPADGGQARLDNGPALGASTLRALACAGRIRMAVRASDGRTLDIGRASRRPTSRQLTALWHRDRGCAVPGCGRIRFLHAHHVLAWSRGGRTSMDNLILLCGDHHRALHDGEFGIVALNRQRFRFHGPRGDVCPPAPRTSGTASSLVDAHCRTGSSAIETGWDGAALNLGYAVSGYLQAWEAAARRVAAVA